MEFPFLCSKLDWVGGAFLAYSRRALLTPQEELCESFQNFEKLITAA